MAQPQVYPSSSTNVTTAPMTPGVEWQDESGNVYMVALVEDANLAANDVVEYSDTTGYEVTKDRSGGSSLGRIAAGVAVATVTDGNYGVIQRGGVATLKVPAATAVAAGNALVPHATTDGAVAVATTSTVTQVFAVALAADTATTSGAGTVTAKIVRV